MTDFAVVGSSVASIDIGGPAEFVPFSLMVSEPGLYVVFARVVIANDDGDPQNIMARISHDAEFVIDRVDIRLPGRTRAAISLQGTLQVAGAPKRIDLKCATFNGTATQSSIFAIPVGNLRFH